MIIKAGDDYNNFEYLSPQKILKIIFLLDDYMSKQNVSDYYIKEIAESNIQDKNNRVDIQVVYSKNKDFISQKLLILKDEVIDGKTFHQRFSEWY